VSLRKLENYKPVKVILKLQNPLTMLKKQYF